MVPTLVIRDTWCSRYDGCLHELQGGRPASYSPVWRRLQKLYAKGAKNEFLDRYHTSHTTQKKIMEMTDSRVRYLSKIVSLTGGLRAISYNTPILRAQNLKTEIDKTDREIDQMVYELYGLSEEEIKIVENSIK